MRNILSNTVGSVLAALLSLLGPSTTNAAGTPVEIASGGDYTCALASEGWVKCWGLNDEGELGDGTTTNSALPVRVVGLGLRNQAAAIGAGPRADYGEGAHTCAVMRSGAVRCWGLNKAGELGDGTAINRSTPVNVVGLNAAIVSVKLGGDHTCALTSTGGVKCWGYNVFGQLGDGTTTNRLTPVDVVSLSSGVTQIAAGGSHTCAVTTTGGVKCWGHNDLGELGDGSQIDRYTPVDVASLTSGVTAVAAGYSHTCALLISGGAKCWGTNRSYQLGHGVKKHPRPAPVDVLGLSSATSISARAFHTCAVLQDGKVKCWGYNREGQLDDGTYDTNEPHAVPAKRIRDVSMVSSGQFHTCALLQSNVIRCWGDNVWGELGNGETERSNQPPVKVRRF